MPSPNNVLTADSYVQEGLVFQLDGIDYGGIDGQWIDRVGGIIATLRGVEKRANSFRFVGGASALFDRAGGWNLDSFCLDVLMHLPRFKGQALKFSQGTQNMGIRLVAGVNNGDVWGLSNQNGQGIQTNRSLYLAHFQSNWIVRNGLKSYYNSPISGFGDSSSPGILLSQSIIYGGNIYSIRVYSRQLSDREILINQKIDNVRFGLGLDIPDEVQPATRSLMLSLPNDPDPIPDEYIEETEQPDYENER